MESPFFHKPYWHDYTRRSHDFREGGFLIDSSCGELIRSAIKRKEGGQREALAKD